MKRFFYIPLAALVFAATFLPAQQPAPGNKTSSAQPGKRPPQAKTPAEFADYNAAYATKGGAAMEKAAGDFATKYPSSELRAYLYAKAMNEYQAGNDTPKILAMGEQVLTLDPDHTVALIITATVLSDSLAETDPDRAKKVAVIQKKASHALETVDNSTVSPAGITPAQLTVYKNTLRSMAHSALGITALKLSDNAEAEKEFKIAAELGKAKPDAFVWYHLALAQDRAGTAAASADEQQKKYSEALVSVREALRYAASNPDLGTLAEGEQRRLLQLTGQGAGTAPQAQPQPSPLQH